MFIIEKLTVHTSEDKQKKKFITVQHTSGHVKVSTLYDHHVRPTLLFSSSV
jgi:tRNA A37 threonylcarbamoyltransferase TsaD